jgi:hypothetical protein
MHTPVALFVYNRPRHARQAIEALLQNPEASTTDVYVFSDGPRCERDRPQVDAVRQMLGSVEGFGSFHVESSAVNKGLARSIIHGVTQLCESRGAVIVLEDDLVAAPTFLNFMNAALTHYADVDQVACISGYCYPTELPLPDTFLLRNLSSWGWATWRRSWRLFRPDPHALLKEIEDRRLIRTFDINGAHHFSRMLRLQCKGRIDSWAIRWYASLFLAEKLTLFPGRTLIRNIGHDGSGVHGVPTEVFNSPLAERLIALAPIPVLEHAFARNQFERFFVRCEAGRIDAALYWTRRLLEKTANFLSLPGLHRGA